jgi:hypothetical protein
MAITNYTANIAALGVQTTEAERRTLGLKLFSGEVMNAFVDEVATEGKVRTISIADGAISAQFIQTGTVMGGFHSPGTAIATQITKQQERVISLDDILYSATWWPLEYDLVGHVDTRAEYARQSGIVLAHSKDTANFAELIKAARSAATIPGVTSAGSQIVSDKFKLSADAGVDGGAVDETELAVALFNAIFAAAELYDTKNVPFGQRYLAFRPYYYHLLVRTIMSQGFSLTNRDYMGMPANINDATLPPIAGIQILKSNRVPNSDLTATGDARSGTPNTNSALPVHSSHVVDASKTIGIFWTPEAIGNVVRQGITTKMESQLDYMGDLVVSMMLMGGGVLRPECAIELTLDNLDN